jgi:hypothetical protein
MARLSLGQLHFRSDRGDISGYTEIRNHAGHLGGRRFEHRLNPIDGIFLACIEV